MHKGSKKTYSSGKPLLRSGTIAERFIFSLSKMFRSRVRRCCNPFCVLKYVRFRGMFAILLGCLSLASLVLVYQDTRVLSSASYKRRLHISQMGSTDKTVLAKKHVARNNSAACRLPSLDPFHPSVVQFMKDLGELRCEGVGFSRFESNVLWVEGEGIVSAQYRKIERTSGNDFDVVLSDPITVQNTSGSLAVDGNQKGEFRYLNSSLYIKFKV